MEGKISAKLMFKSDETFKEVQDAVTKLRKGVLSKRARIEESFPSPSDYGKSKQTHDSILDHRSLCGLYASLQVEA